MTLTWTINSDLKRTAHARDGGRQAHVGSAACLRQRCAACTASREGDKCPTPDGLSPHLLSLKTLSVQSQPLLFLL